MLKEEKGEEESKESSDGLQDSWPQDTQPQYL